MSALRRFQYQQACFTRVVPASLTLHERHPIRPQEQQLGARAEGASLSSELWLSDPISTSDTPPGALPEGFAMEAANEAWAKDSCGLPFTLLIRATAPLTLLVL